MGPGARGGVPEQGEDLQAQAGVEREGVGEGAAGPRGGEQGHGAGLAGQATPLRAQAGPARRMASPPPPPPPPQCAGLMFGSAMQVENATAQLKDAGRAN